MSTLSPKFTVLIPAYNEEAFIRRCVRETCQVMDTHARGDYEVIVIDDGSQDATYTEAVRATLDVPHIHVVRCSENLGKGGALHRGFEYSRGELVFFLDADLDIHPNQLWVLRQVMDKVKADVVVGTKHHPESQVEYPLLRRVVSAGYMLMVRVLFDLPLHDTQTGIKLFRRQVLQQVYPRTQIGRFAFDLEMLVAATRSGYRVVEVPVKVTFERGNQGRIGIWNIVRMFQDTLRIFYRASFWKWLSPSWQVKTWLVVLGFGLVLTGIGLGHLLIGLPVPPSMRGVFELLALHFLDRALRNWVFFGVGVVTVAGALIQLNKYLLAAFARADQGDLAGIIQQHMQLKPSWVDDRVDDHE